MDGPTQSAPVVLCWCMHETPPPVSGPHATHSMRTCLPSAVGPLQLHWGPQTGTELPVLTSGNQLHRGTSPPEHNTWRHKKSEERNTVHLGSSPPNTDEDLLRCTEYIELTDETMLIIVNS